MNFGENFRLALSCIRANKMRSILTMLGIIIGISSVITISTIGASLRATIEKTVSDMAGVNQIYCVLMDSSGEYDGSTMPELTVDTLTAYREAFKGAVSSVEVELNCGEGTITKTVPMGREQTGNVEEESSKNKKDLKANVIACTEGYAQINGLKVLRGRDISFADRKRPVAMISDLAAERLFGEGTPIGEQIDVTLENGDVLSVYIIGEYEYSQASALFSTGIAGDMDNPTTTMIIPIEYLMSARGINKEALGLQYFSIFTESGADAATVMEKTQDYFNNKVIPKGSNWSMYCESLEQQMSTINSVLNAVTVAISVIAAISLVVGGIGVMNIMLVSVVERTREIGIRKALGAKNKTIEQQFLVEAVMICCIGGIIGILLGLLNGVILAGLAKTLLTEATSSILKVSIQPSPVAIIVSFVFSMVVGVIFGLYPAQRAARLSPIDALRYE